MTQHEYLAHEVISSKGVDAPSRSTKWQLRQQPCGVEDILIGMPPSPLDQLVNRADDVLKGRTTGLEDWRDALDIYQQAGNMGSGRAFSRIGRMYFTGTGVKRSPEKVIQNFKKAVSLGCFEDYALLVSAYLELGEVQSARVALKHYLDNPISRNQTPEGFMLRSDIIVRMSRYRFAFSRPLINFHYEQAIMHLEIAYLIKTQIPEKYTERISSTYSSVKSVWPDLAKNLSIIGKDIGSFEDYINRLESKRLRSEEADRAAEAADRIVERNRNLAAEFLSKMKQLAAVFVFADVDHLLEKVKKPLAIWKSFPAELIEENSLIHYLSHHAFRSKDDSPSAAILLYFFLAETGRIEAIEDLCRIFVDYRLEVADPFVASQLLDRYAHLDAEMADTLREEILSETRFVADYFEDDLPEAKRKVDAFEFLISAGHLECCRPYAEMLLNKDGSVYNPRRAEEVLALLPTSS